MARNIRAAEIEALPRPITAVGNDYPAGHLHPPHRHGRSQLLFAEIGTMLVKTAEGSWLVPPLQAIWIPAGVVHSITMLCRVATRSVYLDREAARGIATDCQVVGVSSLLRQLLIEAVDLPSEYDGQSRAGKLMSLLIDEIHAAPVLRSASRFRTTPGFWRAASDFWTGRTPRTPSASGATNSH
jgi:hypothetical protein